MMKSAPLVVLSHLRWNFVYQRPQHLLSRIARSRPVYFVEEPWLGGDEFRWERIESEGQVVVLRPHLPAAEPGFSEASLAAMAAPLRAQLAAERVEECVAWFYTPMALPLLDAIPATTVVYDCMDELSLFKGAPPQLLDRERDLLRRADVVFTGGPSLYRAKRDRHPNVHCFSSSVDAAHFGKAKLGHVTVAEPPVQAAVPGPRLGYFGVIDERLDIDLLRQMASAHPDWQIVMVGPVVKIDPESLPRAANIHYFGQQSYQDLPAFLSGWDVCLLPFAKNDSTRFISPTKTLEYMAAERPIVSTPITDVAEPYGEIVYLADTADEFVAACERALTDNEAETARRVGRMRDVLAKTSWDSTAMAMERLIEQAEQGQAGDSRGRTGAAGASRRPGDGRDPRFVVIGAGPTGLSAAYHLGDESVLVEAEGRVGGWCRSIVDHGFTFDFAGHIMFSKDEYVHEMYRLLLGDNVHWQDREAWIYSKDVFTRYPFQGALYGLPPEVIRECLLGAIEARYEPAAAAPAANGGTGNGHGGPRSAAGSLIASDEKVIEDCCGDGILESSTKLAACGAAGPPAGHANGHATNGHSEAGQAPATNGNGNGHGAAGQASDGTEFRGSDGQHRNFEEFIYRVWGRGIAKHFAIPYNRKLWAVDLKEMETSWLGGRVPMPDLGEIIDGALSPAAKPVGPNARFGYPLRGGFQALMNGFLPRLEGELVLNTRVTRVSPSARSVTLSDGRVLPYEKLVSTMPLPQLVRAMGEEVPDHVRRAAAGLRHVSVRCVNLGIGRENLTEKHWIYYPEETVFHRIFVQGNASPHCNPPGGFGLTCEITYSPSKPLPCDGEALIDRCIADCIEVGLFTADDPVLARNQIDMPYAYVVYDHDRTALVRTIREWMEAQDIVLAGRYSEWEYYNSDHAFLAGRRAAEDCRREKAGAPAGAATGRAG